LGADLQKVQSAFQPEGGAYGHGHHKHHDSQHHHE
jgi:urease accessory protein UreE